MSEAQRFFRVVAIAAAAGIVGWLLGLADVSAGSAFAGVTLGMIGLLAPVALVWGWSRWAPSELATIAAWIVLAGACPLLVPAAEPAALLAIAAGLGVFAHVAAPRLRGGLAVAIAPAVGMGLMAIGSLLASATLTGIGMLVFGGGMIAVALTVRLTGHEPGLVSWDAALRGADRTAHALTISLWLGVAELALYLVRLVVPDLGALHHVLDLGALGADVYAALALRELLTARGPGVTWAAAAFALAVVAAVSCGLGVLSTIGVSIGIDDAGITTLVGSNTAAACAALALGALMERDQDRREARRCAAVWLSVLAVSVTATLMMTVTSSLLVAIVSSAASLLVFALAVVALQRVAANVRVARDVQSLE